MRFQCPLKQNMAFTLFNCWNGEEMNIIHDILMSPSPSAEDFKVASRFLDSIRTVIIKDSCCISENGERAF